MTPEIKSIDGDGSIPTNPASMKLQATGCRWPISELSWRRGLTTITETIAHLVLHKKGYETRSSASSAICPVCRSSCGVLARTSTGQRLSRDNTRVVGVGIYSKDSVDVDAEDKGKLSTPT